MRIPSPFVFHDLLPRQNGIAAPNPSFNDGGAGRGDRQPSNNEDKRGSKSMIIAIIVILAVVALLLIIYVFLRLLRIRSKNPKYIPFGWLKRKWMDWDPAHTYDHVHRREQTLADVAAREGLTSSNRRTTGLRGTPASANAPVDRNTSIRSVITLPPYMPSPSSSERVLGIEGERAGVDVIVTLPETTEEQEERREGEMEALYQIRVARRREAAEREDRRRRRREARAAGDLAALDQIRAERARAMSSAADSATSLSASILAAETQSQGRERRVSSVSYADIGLARHDGSRVRASEESERPLLEAAAGHSRGRSTSALSISSMASDDTPAYTPQRSREGSTVYSVRLGQPVSRDSSSRPSPELRLDTEREPPRYERSHEPRGEAPPYESPVQSGAPRLPAMAALPAIEIQTATPGPSRAGTQVRREE